jgi:hypothetical protein
MVAASHCTDVHRIFDRQPPKDPLYRPRYIQRLRRHSIYASECAPRTSESLDTTIRPERDDQNGIQYVLVTNRPLAALASALTDTNSEC